MKPYKVRKYPDSTNILCYETESESSAEKWIMEEVTVGGIRTQFLISIEFDTKEEAFEWMRQKIDDHTMHNERFAFLDNEEEIFQYQAALDAGCCGSFDDYIVVSGKKAKIGCNYGH